MEETIAALMLATPRILRPYRRKAQAALAISGCDTAQANIAVLANTVLCWLSERFPLLLHLGHLVRECNWAGENGCTGLRAQELLQLTLCLLERFGRGPCDIRFGPREAGDGKMRQGATGRRQGGDRKTTGWRQENNRKAAGKRQGSDKKRQTGDRKAAGEVRQEGNREATGRRQSGDRETTGKQQETRHSDKISDRKAKGRQQEGDRASGDSEETGKRQEKATGERQESDRRAAGCFFATGRRQEGDRKATGMRQESDRLVEDKK